MRGQYRLVGCTLLSGVEELSDRDMQQDCMNCSQLQHVRGSGARVCVGGFDPCPVICGKIKCTYWEPMNA